LVVLVISTPTTAPTVGAEVRGSGRFMTENIQGSRLKTKDFPAAGGSRRKVVLTP